VRPGLGGAPLSFAGVALGGAPLEPRFARAGPSLLALDDVDYQLQDLLDARRLGFASLECLAPIANVTLGGKHVELGA
jgi:hypothetical protein